jgi:uncharacterized membrane protein
VLSLLHAWQLSHRTGALCLAWAGDLLPVGIIAHYACVAADTFSSELGILSTAEPRLITSLTFRKVPRGTNGGVTLWGLTAGLLGSVLVVTASMLFTPLCPGWTVADKRSLMWFLTLWGGFGSVVDSVLGGLLQRSVRDVRSGKIVAGEGGKRVLIPKLPAAAPSSSSPASKNRVNSEHMMKRAQVQAALLSGEGADAVPHQDAVVEDSEGSLSSPPSPRGKGSRRASYGDEKPSRVVESGLDLLNNNDVNFLMALTMSVGAMAVAGWYWDVPFSSITAV